jgi:hypothetical protein
VTGPDHYQAAERALADSSLDHWDARRADGNRGRAIDALLAKAQVHATLALAAAALEAAIGNNDEGWNQVTR